VRKGLATIPGFMKVSLFFLILAIFFVSSLEAKCPVGDLNGDCKVNFLDMQVFAEQWLVVPESPADLNGDEHNLIEGDQVVLTGELDNGYSSQWHAAAYNHLDSYPTYELIGGTMDIWMDTDSEHAGLHWTMMLRSSTLTVDYEPIPARCRSVSQHWCRPCRMAKKTNDPIGLNGLNYALMA